MVQPEGPLQHLASVIRKIEDVLVFLPDDLVKDIRAKIATVRSLLLEQRPPAIALVGRRGAGKSSVVNALFGKKVAAVGHIRAQTGQGQWYRHESTVGILDVLDTRGLQEGSPPVEEDSAPNAIVSITAEIRKKCPDLVLFIVKASDVDSAIDSDLEGLEQILEDARREHNTKPSFITIVTHCDILEPRDTKLDETETENSPEHAEKLHCVAEAERAIEAKINSHGSLRRSLVRAFGVSTYMSWREDDSLRTDGRWRISDLASLIQQHLPNATRAEFARIVQVRKLQDDLASQLSQAMAALCAAVAASPIPFSDVFPITATQLALVASIAWISGRPADLTTAAEFLAGIGLNLGAAVALREATRALIKFVFPGAGTAVSATMAYVGTQAIGAAAKAYFIHNEPISISRNIFEKWRSNMPSPETNSPNESETHNSDSTLEAESTEQSPTLPTPPESLFV